MIKRFFALFLTVFLFALPASAATDQSAAPLPVRFGVHAGFSRLVFDWDRKVDYHAALDGRRLSISFDALATPQLAALRADPPPGVASVKARREAGRLIVEVGLDRPVKLRHFRDFNRIAVDLLLPSQQAAPAAQAAPVAQAAPAAQAAPVAQAAPADAQLGPEGLPTAPHGDDEDDDDDVPESLVGALTVEALEDGVRLSFPWTQAVAAAVFSRAGFLWVVFDHPGRFDLAALSNQGHGYVFGGTNLDHAGAAVLRFKIDPQSNLRASRQGTVWSVDLTDMPTGPKVDQTVQLFERSDVGMRAFISTTGDTRVIALIDPEVGDELDIVPLPGGGAGVAKARLMVEFHLLETAQGIVLQPLSDRLQVVSRPNGIAIALTDHPHRAPASSVATAQTEPSADKKNAGPAALIDLAAWRRGDEAEFRDNQRALMRAVTEAPVEERQAAQFTLARFYLGHGLAAEALGLLDIMLKDNKELAEAPAFLAARGVGRVLMGWTEEAGEDLFNPLVGIGPHVALWQSLVAEKQEKWEEALRLYREGVGVLPAYTPRYRALFRLGAVRAALAGGDLEMARRELFALQQDDLPAKYSTDVLFLQGRLDEAMGVDAEALVAYEKVIEGGVRHTRAQALLARTRLLLANGGLRPEQAIEELEKLRFLWRGDGLELEVLRWLGQLYLDKGDYRSALLRWRTAVTYFSGKSTTRTIARAIAHNMDDVFRRLFLDGDADALSPVTALALYYDFRELTPLGKDGDEMIRRLSERLVAIDLLDRAEKLLLHQVRYRMKGTAQAQVAGRLALIYLIDKKPQKALDILLETRQARLPDSIAIRRRYLEARAMLDLGSYDEALDMLEDDRSQEAEALRADIFWAEEDWGKVAASARILLGEAGANGAPLSLEARRQVIRLAVALSMDDDQAGLAAIRARYKSAMADGAFAAVFNAITQSKDPSGLELSKAIEKIADVSAFQSYLASYRDELNTATN
jgi:tetratricopeptide (TPR) repeat protein